MMQPSHLKRHAPSVPRGFIMQHIRKIKETATLRHLCRSWPVKLKRCGHRATRFASGWLAFRREARLRLGNVCVFELIDGDDIVFKVYIFDGAGGNEESKCAASPSDPVFRGPTPLRPLTTAELANEIDSAHPFFKLVIPEYQTHKMNVPVEFTRKHIQESTDMMAVLRYLDRSWPVKILRYKQDHRAFFSGGWPAFARENCLRVGDVCMFELIDRDDFVFKVSIFHSAACVDTDLKEPDLSQAQADSTDRIQQSRCRLSHSELVSHVPPLPMPLAPPELAHEFNSEYPFFKMEIPQSYKSCLSIPVEFIKRHIQENKETVTLMFSGKSWPVKLLSYTQTRKTKWLSRCTHDTRVFFTSGWRAFARETHMRVGNICAFELIDSDDVVFRVSIFSSTGGIEQSTCRASQSEPVFHGPTLPRSLASPELASNIDTENPFFKLVIPRSYTYCLGVPDGFARQHIQENKQIATLRYSDRSWPVKLTRSRGRGRRNPSTFFSSGWGAFARETHVRAGSVCMFELIKRDDTVFRVSISSGTEDDPIPID
ncbi:hypothetical protein BT93_G0580 [Corymbia citriodora subsp. variegata]|nr:hypothetical protein BT93_G0580 [Corymbia citriodora subsp. variegata]